LREAVGKSCIEMCRFWVEDNSKIEGCTLKLFVFDNLIVGRREIRSFLVIDV
jgi:hypothetical protein